MKKYILIISFLVSLLTAQISIGDYMGIYSEVLNEKRVLLVHLPDNYDDDNVRFPVLYLLDGDAYFNYLTCYQEYLEESGILPPMIIIGIRNVDRTRDFTPSADAKEPTSGGADNFIKFLETELIPAVEENFKAAPYRILFGHSLGGLLTLYTLQARPDLFEAYLAVSPALHYDDNFLSGYTNPAISGLTKEKFVYISIGESESGLLPPLRKYEQHLERIYPLNLKKEVEVMENTDHRTVVPPSIASGLELLYPSWRFPARDIVGGIQAIQRHYNDLSKRYGYEITPSEDVVNNIGYMLLERGYLSRAVAVFKYNTELYPNSPNVYDSLGECYLKIEQYELAQTNFEIAIQKGRESNDPNLYVFERHLKTCEELNNK